MEEKNYTDTEWVAMRNVIMLDFIKEEKKNLKNGMRLTDSKMVDRLYTILINKMGGGKNDN